MRKRLCILLVLMMMFNLTLVACGGGGGDPVVVVTDMIKTIQEKKFDRLPNFACAAKKEEVANRFNISAALAPSLGPNVDAQKVLDAAVFEFINMEYKEVSRSDVQAIVYVKGRLKVTLDPDKFKEPVRELLMAQSPENVTDSLVDQVTGFALAQFGGFGEDIDITLGLVNEGGKWLICGSQG